MELEAFKQKFNLPRINAYLKQLDEDEVNWFWQALWQVKQIFPTMDIYHTGSSKYGYIGVGIKPNFETRVSNFILSSELNKHKDEHGNFKFFVGVVQTFVDLIVSEEDKIEYWFKSKDVKSRNFQEWLEQIKKYAVKHNYSFSGQGLLPTDYKKQNFTAQHAIEFLKDRFPNTYSGTEHIAAFRTSSSRQLALDPKTQSVSIFCDAKPPENTGLNVKNYYEAGKTRNHHLSTHAPDLDKGFDAYLVSIDTLEDLEKFCDWYELNSDEIYVNDNLNEDHKMQKSMLNQPLNRILFGAAGTGKTFNTINHALSIIENISLEKLETETREELKKRFDVYKENDQIKFVTFHQSFSYEDFVEGIRAESDKDGNLNYLVKDGVFKEICGVTPSNQFRNLIGKEFGRGYVLQSINSDCLSVKKPNGNLIHLSLDLALLLLEKVVENEITVEDINQKLAIEKLEANPLLEPYIINGYCTVWANLIQLMLDNSAPENTEKSPCVLIIDEINRGNISRIFGELITLIEDSKRAGADEELSVTLPYSKQEFTVPQNIYIIGTMNSSDRSLTGLDIALRRRFTFIEMPPRPEEIKNQDGELLKIFGKDQNGNDKEVVVADLLSVINQRIEVLLDRDHCLGHANFMSLKEQPTLEHLAHIFKQKIIPQLQEYFFDDWTKINLVFFNNKMLVEDDLTNNSSLFPSNFEQELGYSNEKKIWKINTEAFKTIDAFIQILGPKE